MCCDSQISQPPLLKGGTLAFVNEKRSWKACGRTLRYVNIVNLRLGGKGVFTTPVQTCSMTYFQDDSSNLMGTFHFSEEVSLYSPTLIPIQVFLENGLVLFISSAFHVSLWYWTCHEQNNAASEIISNHVAKYEPFDFSSLACRCLNSIYQVHLALCAHIEDFANVIIMVSGSALLWHCLALIDVKLFLSVCRAS